MDSQKNPELKDALKIEIEREVHEIKTLKNPARVVSSRLSQQSRKQKNEWIQIAETEWINQREVYK